MDPLDPDGIRLDGLSCAVCDGPVPAGSVHLLARRDGLTFVQLDCPGCASTSLAFLVAPAALPAPHDVVDARPVGPVDRAPDAAAAPLSADDVLDMHGFLERWRGGLKELVGSDPPASQRA